MVPSVIFWKVDIASNLPVSKELLCMSRDMIFWGESSVSQLPSVRCIMIFVMFYLLPYLVIFSTFIYEEGHSDHISL